MGKDKLALEAIIPMTDSESWEGRYVINRQPNGNWTSIDYDDKDWSLGKAAFGTPDMRRIGIEWKGNNSDIWIRREFSINELDKDARIYLKYSHDDIFELYINGEKIVTTDLSWNNDVLLELTEEMKLKLKQGTNVIAAHCHNTTGEHTLILAYINSILKNAILKMSLFKKMLMFCQHKHIIHSSVDL